MLDRAEKQRIREAAANSKIGASHHRYYGYAPVRVFTRLLGVLVLVVLALVVLHLFGADLAFLLSRALPILIGLVLVTSVTVGVLFWAWLTGRIGG